MIRTIVAVERDGVDVRILVLNFDVPNKDFDLQAAVEAACVEYCQTEGGKETYERNCNCFNWADFDVHVPNEICEKHGFKKVDTVVADQFVNWDEQLVDDDEVFFGDEEKEV